eukprot:TRINITY_DN13843_c0_g1_i1.p1 TRINITY_DN13843_c0_g1~~TRINITY_DN13843_c0_g1_i1.p1  ORF type:complete len:181 (+),score=15.58 TRINITY_DN13843_c0_g1_i1:413-955(+)
MGIMCGAVVGAMLLSLRANGLVEGAAAEWAIVGSLSLVMAISISLVFQKPLICVSTSLLGAFGVASCIDYFTNCQSFGGVLRTMIQEGSLNPIRVDGGVWSWLFFVSTLVLAAFGTSVQLFYTAKTYRHRRTSLRMLFSSLRRFFSSRGCCCRLICHRGRSLEEDDDGNEVDQSYVAIKD